MKNYTDSVLYAQQIIDTLGQDVPPGAFATRATTYDYKQVIGLDHSNALDAIIWHYRDKYTDMQEIGRLFLILTFRTVSMMGWNPEVVAGLSVLHALTVKRQEHLKLHGHIPVHLDALVLDYVTTGEINTDEVY